MWAVCTPLLQVLVCFFQAFWRRRGLSGEFVTYGGVAKDGSRGPLCVAYDASTANENPALVAFIGADQAVAWGDKEVGEPNHS